MPGLGEREPHPRSGFRLLPVRHADDPPECLVHVGGRVQRFDPRLGVVPGDVQVGRVLLLMRAESRSITRIRSRVAGVAKIGPE